MGLFAFFAKKYLTNLLKFRLCIFLFFTDMQDDTNNNKEFSRVLTVLNKMGIHARPAAMIVRISNKYPSTDIWVEKDGERVNGKSIMSLMMLAAGRGSKIKFVAQGEDAEQMLDEIEALFARAFDEKD